MDQEQLDRIEAMLNELMDLKGILLKIFMPKIPEKMRPQMLKMMAARSGSGGE